jgi:hypothetical protein
MAAAAPNEVLNYMRNTLTIPEATAKALILEDGLDDFQDLKIKDSHAMDIVKNTRKSYRAPVPAANGGCVRAVPGSGALVSVKAIARFRHSTVTIWTGLTNLLLLLMLRWRSWSAFGVGEKARLNRRS